MSDNTLVCLKCGTEIQENVVFCPKCGTKSGTEPKKKSSLGKKILYGIGGVFALFVGLIIIAAIVGPSNPTTQAPTSSTPSVASPTIENQDVCYFDWEFSTTKTIGSYYSAPTGYNYAIVNIYLKNNADGTVSTNPFYWVLTVDGIKYTADSSTFSSDIGHQSVDVAKGGEIETKIVYVVKGDPSTATLNYNGLGRPDMVRIKHY